MAVTTPFQVRLPFFLTLPLRPGRTLSSLLSFLFRLRTQPSCPLTEFCTQLNPPPPCPHFKTHIPKISYSIFHVWLFKLNTGIRDPRKTDLFAPACATRPPRVTTTSPAGLTAQSKQTCRSSSSGRTDGRTGGAESVGGGLGANKTRPKAVREDEDEDDGPNETRAGLAGWLAKKEDSLKSFRCREGRGGETTGLIADFFFCCQTFETDAVCRAHDLRRLRQGHLGRPAQASGDHQGRGQSSGPAGLH